MIIKLRNEIYICNEAMAGINNNKNKKSDLFENEHFINSCCVQWVANKRFFPILNAIFIRKERNVKNKEHRAAIKIINDGGTNK